MAADEARPGASRADRVAVTATPGFRQRAAARCLRGGGVIAYPTEAVYGLGCDPGDPRAVGRLLALKHRPVSKGLILIADRVERLAGWVDAAALASRQVHADWPGAVSWVLPAGPLAAYWITGIHDSIAVRVTAHPGAASLCRAWGAPLVSTSANPDGRAPARTACRVRGYFDNRLDYILGGPTGGRSAPSRIRRWPDGAVLRPG
ncbi:L-threonylcarbamoyladenylate synthase [Arhodomonas sp. AD133]|uniref:L-threonylcarbamoyladenylate synthase n=1 Tax=Arhodomonas sp. AD133 TaxID=3415009 RepID=UPI003EBDE90E